MAGVIERQFGTFRGLVRLALAHGEVLLGAEGAVPPDPHAVRRLVFVCHGNICRSAYAQALARGAGLNAASFGLSAGTGNPAHPPLAQVALARGVDLADHMSTAVADYQPAQGDYLLAMESRHLRRIARDSRIAGLPRGLLGALAGFPHLHDPYEIEPAYTPVCLMRIERAVARLPGLFPNAAS